MRSTFSAKIISILALALFCAGCESAWQTPYASVCQVRVSGGQGSGCLISTNGDYGLVLSCRHVVSRIDAAAKLEWLAHEGETTLGTGADVVPGSEFNNDLALIICRKPPGVKPSPVAKFDAANGPWRAVGFRGGQLYETVFTEAVEENGLIKFNQPLVAGMSGGPVFDRNGCVVGVGVGSDFKTRGVAADGVYLQEILRNHSK